MARRVCQLVCDLGVVAESPRPMTAELSVCRYPELGPQIQLEFQSRRVCVSCDCIMYCINQAAAVPDRSSSRRLIWQQTKVGGVSWQDEQDRWHKQLVWGRASPAEFGASLFEVVCRCGNPQAQEKLLASDGGAWCWDLEAC